MSLDQLRKWADPMLPNIADNLDETVKNDIGQKVVRDYTIDKDSRREWEEKNETGMKLAKQMKESGGGPWDKSANIMYPLVTSAAFQFGARAYPEFVQGNEVVKVQVVGDDPQGLKEMRGERISKHMSWQLLHEMEEWDEETDKLLHIVPITGCAFRKTYFCPTRGHNVSELVLPDDCVINQKARSLKTARRVTHRYWLYNNEIKEFMRSGLWLEKEFGPAPTEQGDEDAPHEILEQHRWYDLDEDGYQEPYIATVHKATGFLLRLKARYEVEGIQTFKGKLSKIQDVQYFTMYPFMPDPAGGFYPIGFGALLSPINEAVNAVINQLLDAGTLANLGGGFVAKGIRIAGGVLKFKPGEWKMVDTTGSALRDGLFPLPAAQPSPVLFQLLGVLIEAGREISSVKDVLTGGDSAMSAQAQPTTVLALIEQGLKLFTAIYKRLYRAMSDEYRKLYRLNGIYMEGENYFRVLDDPQATQIMLSDYQTNDYDIYPVADPSLSTDAQRLLKSRALMEVSGRPGLNEVEVTRRMVKTIKPGNEEKILLADDQIPQPPPDPKLITAQLKANQVGMEMQMALDKHQLEMEKLIADIGETKSRTIANIAKAESLEVGPQMQQYEREMQLLENMAKMKIDLMKERIKANAPGNGSANQQGGMAEMAGGAGNEGVSAGAAPGEAGMA